MGLRFLACREHGKERPVFKVGAARTLDDDGGRAYILWGGAGI